MQENADVLLTIILTVLVLVFLGIFMLVMLARHNIRKNRLIFENERIKKDFEQALLNTKLEIQEQTLSHISSEIHDNIGQVLTLARLHLNSKAEQDESVIQTDELLEKAIADLRGLSHLLNTNNIRESGFLNSLKKLAGQIRNTGKFIVIVEADEEPDLSADQSLILFRIVQEVLTNSVKHSSASKIFITLNQRQIVIRDDGSGFDYHKVAENGKGIGLNNMRERAETIRSKLVVNSQPAKGTTVEITIDQK